MDEAVLGHVLARGPGLHLLQGGQAARGSRDELVGPAYMPLAHPARVVALGSQLRGEGGEFFIELDPVGHDAVGLRVEPGEDAGPGGGAGESGNVVLVESHAAGGEAVEVGCVDVRVAVGPHGVQALLVGHDVEHVRTAEALRAALASLSAQSDGCSGASEALNEAPAVNTH